MTVYFTDKSTGTVTSYAWDFNNDGIIDSTVKNPSYTYANPGSYTVKLTVSNTAGSDTISKSGFITATTATVQPVAGFTATPVSGTAPLAVQFTDQSTGTVTSWAWDFNNDGVVDSTVRNPAYTYPSSGTFTVKFSVQGPGGSDNEIKTNYITVNSPSKQAFFADFQVSPAIGTVPLTIKCTDKSVGNPYSFYYDFGDGVNVTGPNPAHTYRYPGVYTITLTIIRLDPVTNSVLSSSMVKTNAITVNKAS